ncbi:hypothetical protein TNCV_2538191 [Trichonephila clavipes]|nr:hypothetical protein TNCV_2538191 [Trichonephila clavipes]
MLKIPTRDCLAWVFSIKFIQRTVSHRQSKGALPLGWKLGVKITLWQLISTYLVSHQHVIPALGECNRSSMIITNPQPNQKGRKKLCVPAPTHAWRLFECNCLGQRCPTRGSWDACGPPVRKLRPTASF